MSNENLLFQSCLGVVLAGGKSSRMGQYKAHLQRNQQDMLSYSKTLLKDAGSSQVVVSGDVHGIADIVSNMGPLGGIQSIINQFKPKALLILPVDLPLMPADELTKLKKIGELSQSACFFTDNYLPLYLPVNAFVEQFFQQSLVQHNIAHKPDNKSSSKRGLSGPSVRSLINQIPHKVIQAKNSNSLFNTNTPEQWQQAQHLLSLQRKTHV
ncbi:molybdenum cofactor guanylyltransferase [Cognaticolwellia mytili]|uniref:molybdenum cofactor guanylyltransferase n=1 Tax=Cognaticolwellia mytili TaxID=1888913 RepID=UPI000A172E57|nr:molybdenum cofactor guanylyltransferase [Cognaticolwellia mytili]